MESRTEKTLMQHIHPSYKSAPGRPKKNRRKGEDEIQQIKGKTKKMRRTGLVNTCTFCHNRGHNIRSCNLRKGAQNAASDGQEPVQQGEASNQQYNDYNGNIF
ncbi:hypothetical protein ACH5RR_017499 [Cinchona calisaya]|uniref:Uncharacterized protein n=1 Tax=Cinchona calisaya TaxID=153742 RepID=A0ABD2ZIR1_9GENT